MSREGRDCDVLIVGLGPVGQLLANLLGMRGLEVIAVEAAEEPYPLPRAAVIDDEALRFLQSAGLDRPALEDAVPQSGFSFITVDGRRLDLFEMRSRPHGHPQLASINQPALERTLLGGLERFERVETRFGAALVDFERSADGVSARIESGDGAETVRAGWLVGCDGARSRVREWLGIRFAGSTFEQAWLVVDGICDRPIARFDRPHFVGNPERPMVSLPMSPGRHRWEWMLHPGEDHEAFTDPDRVRSLVEPWLEGERVELERAVVYVFHARHAARWRAGRVLLAGDAAHAMPPFAGQGLCSGIRDVGNLAWKLAAIEAGADRRLIDSYEAERKPHVSAMAALAVRMGALLQTTSPRRARLRDRFLRLLERVPNLFERVKPAPRYATGAFAAGARRRTGAGELFPQPRVESDARPTLLDGLLGDGWSALSGDEAAAEAFASAGVRSLRPGRDFQDPDDAIGEWLGSRGADWVLLRPDRHVYASGGGVGSARAALAEVRPLIRPLGRVPEAELEPQPG